MPLQYWDEAFITATYLINRLPSKVIGNSTPLERLYHQKPDYHYLKIFGCACYPNLRPYNHHKLEFVPLSVFFLVIATSIKGINVLKYPLDASIFHVMFFLMKRSFLLPNFILMRELYFVLK